MSAQSAVSGHEGWMQSSTCRAVDAAGTAEGRAYGLAESMSRAMGQLLLRQAKQKFGGADAAGSATLDGLAQAFACDRLEELAGRLVTAGGWGEWLAEVVVPPPAPGLPDYTKDVEIDFEPSGPSIDTYMKAATKEGTEEIIHLRLQKWYQPDLDQHLYVESRKLKAKFGKMPTVLVFLLWPPAEGPGTTGRYEDRDPKGKVRHVFTYTIKRAWEMAAEEVVHSPGTMLLAPLSRGAGQRMPEIMQMVKHGLEKLKADASTRELVWDGVYWAMGLIVDLDEAHRALGDQLAVVQRGRHYRGAKGEAFLRAYSAAQSEGPAAAVRAVVLRQATCRFGECIGATERLAGIAKLGELEELAQQVWSAADWEGLLAERPDDRRTF